MCVPRRCYLIGRSCCRDCGYAVVVLVSTVVNATIVHVRCSHHCRLAHRYHLHHTDIMKEEGGGTAQSSLSLSLRHALPESVLVVNGGRSNAVTTMDRMGTMIRAQCQRRWRQQR